MEARIVMTFIVPQTRWYLPFGRPGKGMTDYQADRRAKDWR